MNSVDIAHNKLRELQAKIFDYNTSPNDLFKFTQEMEKYMNDASVEIRTNYEEISAQLTKKMNGK